MNVLDEPYFGTHIVSNYLPFQTSEIPKKNTQPQISIRGLAFNKLLRSSEIRKFHSFRVKSKRNTHLSRIKTKIHNNDLSFCLQCVWQTIQVQKTLTQLNRDVHIEEDIPCSLCEKTFRTKKHLANHKFSQHTEKESLQCDIKSDDTEYSYHTNLKLDALF